ncbi:MAG: 2-succinyl-5-enolpyruvyl-6-hydroxy-3-cyclohexene-1-carboxylic-acid synthase [bacterium]
MNIPKIPLAQTVILQCKKHGISHVVISPGSRNAPLTIGFSNDPFFNCYSIVDERCAAFFALGIAQQIRKPVAVVCTSGSALLNYFPAVSEAFYSKIPLVVLSADRPKHLIDIGDGQTINQQNVYSNHVAYNANLKLDIREESKSHELDIFKNLENKVERFLGIQKEIEAFNKDEISRALSESTLQSSPVHINIPFDEPLYETVTSYDITISEDIDLKNSNYILDTNSVDEAMKDWNNAAFKMIVLGVLHPDVIDNSLLASFANDPSVIVFTETTSNVHHQNFFPCIDKIIAPLESAAFEELKPDILLTFGGMVVSKKIKAFLRKYQPKKHWHCGTPNAYDTYFKLQKHFKVDPNKFLEYATTKKSTVSKSDYREAWLNIRNHRRENHEQYMNKIAFSDLKVFDQVLKSIPDNTHLQVSNSSAIRYVQLFEINPTIEVFCNRGTSGIDGSTSTAIGASLATSKNTLFITGDLSFFYDSNALWNNYIPNSFRIIVINNNGGGIFRILPGNKNTENFDTYFETKHELNASNLCDMYNFDYQCVTNEIELKDKLKSFYKKSDNPKLLEIMTPSTLNDEILLSYFDFIK